VKSKTQLTVSKESVENVILVIRGERVILDSDLAGLCGVASGNDVTLCYIFLLL
jgi:hypothetical protein